MVDLGDHDDAVADHVRGHLLGIDDSRLLTTFTLRPMRAFLSMMARSMTESAPDADRGPAQPLVFLQAGRCMLEESMPIR